MCCGCPARVRCHIQDDVTSERNLVQSVLCRVVVVCTHVMRPQCIIASTPTGQIHGVVWSADSRDSTPSLPMSALLLSCTRRDQLIELGVDARRLLAASSTVLGGSLALDVLVCIASCSGRPTDAITDCELHARVSCRTKHHVARRTQLEHDVVCFDNG